MKAYFSVLLWSKPVLWLRMGPSQTINTKYVLLNNKLLAVLGQILMVNCPVLVLLYLILAISVVNNYYVKCIIKKFMKLNL